MIELSIVQFNICEAVCKKQLTNSLVHIYFLFEDCKILFLDGNVTEANPSSTALVTIMVVPSFIIGVIVGILVISLLIIWR